MNAVNSSQWTRHGRKKHDGELVTDAKKHDSELVTENSLWRVHRVTSSLVTAEFEWIAHVAPPAHALSWVMNEMAYTRLAIPLVVTRGRINYQPSMQQRGK